jgi:hypothetical protein
MAIYRPQLRRGLGLEVAFLAHSIIFTVKKKANDYLADILGELGGGDRDEQIPEGWVSLMRILENSDVPHRTMSTRIQKAVADGKMERRQFRINIGCRSQKVWHYRKIK